MDLLTLAKTDWQAYKAEILRREEVERLVTRGREPRARSYKSKVCGGDERTTKAKPEAKPEVRYEEVHTFRNGKLVTLYREVGPRGGAKKGNIPNMRQLR